jgi:hypothetical protein
MDSKPWYASKTIWAGYVAAALPLVNVASLFLHFTPPDSQIIVDGLTAGGTIVAGLTAVWGRLHATKMIG